MLNRREEYERMAAADRTLWWYRALHSLILDTLGQWSVPKTAFLYDAGCGTGGLMLFLGEQGYSNVRGMDISRFAIEIGRGRGLEIEEGNLSDLSEHCALGTVDVLVAADSLCYLGWKEQMRFLDEALLALSAGGLLILNLPAFSAFRGVHDLAVGISERFDRRQVRRVLAGNKFQIVREIYWPFLLTPIIYLVRTCQRYRLRAGRVTTVCSDLQIPSPWLNQLLLLLTKFENWILPYKPFGSSLFVVLQKPAERKSGRLDPGSRHPAAPPEKPVD